VAQEAVERSLYIKARHIGEYQPWPGEKSKRAVGAYVGLLSGEPDLYLWGCRWITNSEGLYAACIGEGLQELFPYDDSPAIRVVVRHGGFKLYLDEHVSKWMENRGKNSQGQVPDQYEHWKTVFEFCQISRVRISEASGDRDEAALAKLDGLCNGVAARALRYIGKRQKIELLDTSGNLEALQIWIAAASE
jgi:hypothetical protein